MKLATSERNRDMLDLHATILNSVFEVGQMRLDTSLPREVQDRAQRGTPIRALF